MEFGSVREAWAWYFPDTLHAELLAAMTPEEAGEDLAWQLMRSFVAILGDGDKGE